MTDKPKMPEPRPTIKLAGIELRLDADMERYSSGSMRMTHEGAEVSEDGERIGGVYACIPTGIRIEYKGRYWFLGPQELFEAVAAADEAQYPA